MDLHDGARTYPHGMVTLYPVPQHPTDVPQRKFLTGSANFTMDHLDPGQYRVCAWLEEGAKVNSILGNPRYEAKLATACETIPVSADEHKNVQLKQVSAADLR